MTEKKGSKYTFVLKGINIEKIDGKYGLFESNIFPTSAPKNSTNIQELDIGKNIPDVISFLDDAKFLRKCHIAIPNLQGRKNYKCYWDRDIIPIGIIPIGCPIKYVSPKAKKTYFSEISKDVYHISENVTPKRLEELKSKKDSKIEVEENGHYETEGIFCSFNCLMAFIKSKENKANPIYLYSEQLLYKIYKELYGTEIPAITPAGNWTTLEDWGGYKNILDFRDAFNKIESVDHGRISFASLGRLYEEKFKL